MAEAMDDREDSQEVERLVYAERITALYDRGLIALIANLVNAAILAVALRDAVPARPLLIWLALMYVVVLIRLVLWRRQRSVSSTADDVQRWAAVWVVGTAVTGALWGSAGFLLFPADFIGAQDLLLFIIGGMVAGASASMSSFQPAFVAFLVPALAPPILRLLMENDRLHWAMAILLFSFAIGMAAVARTGGQALVRSVRLRFKNTRLVRDLTSAREQLTSLNSELEERVTARTNELQQAVAERENLVSIVSHELRGPLQSLKLNQQILSRLIDDPALEVARLKRLLPVLTRQTERMQRLVEDLLDMGRVSADRMQCLKEPIELSAVVDAAMEQLAPQLAVANQAFTVDIEPGLRGEWDPHRLEQVLTNLMFNALTHGAPPFSISARRANGSARIVVMDNGPGIPPEHRQRIFQAFERIDWSAGGGSGLGLGLHIAQRIVNAHGGVIQVDSEPGRGTSFVVEIPLHPAHASVPERQGM
jgi:signal transduction histidine kinase